ncbi:hypothetical protein KIPB_012215, partial [Kipferlia bialata]
VYIWPILLILSREFVVTAVRLVAAIEHVLISASKKGKMKTFTQMTATNFLMVADMMFDYSETAEELIIYKILRTSGLVLFLVSTLFAMTSGYDYCSKYLHMLVIDDSKPTSAPEDTASQKTKTK